MLGSRASSFAGASVATATVAGRVAPARLVVTAGAIGPGKRWEQLPTNSKGKVIKTKMHVKTGDTVQVIAGSDKGKVGEVVRVYAKTNKVIVKDVNIVTRHKKPMAQGETGTIDKQEGPIHASNVMHYSKEQGVRSRVGIKVLENGDKVRFLRKTGEVIDKKE